MDSVYGHFLFCIVLYLWVPIVLYPCYSFLLVYSSKHLYEMYLNTEQYEHKSNQLGCEGIPLLYTIVYLRAPSVMKFLLCTPMGEMNTMICEIFIHACIL